MEVFAQPLWLRLAVRVEQYLCPLFVQLHLFSQEKGCHKHGRYLLAVIYVTIVSVSHAISVRRRSLSQGELKTRLLQDVIHQGSSHTSSRLMEVFAQPLWLRVAERGERYPCSFFVQYHTLREYDKCANDKCANRYKFVVVGPNPEI